MDNGMAPPEAIAAAAQATAEERAREMRLFMVVQHGLNFSDAALAVAAAQATWRTLSAARESHSERVAAYDEHVQPKICLRAKNDGAIERAMRDAAAAGLPAQMVAADSAEHPGTARQALLAIGPALRSELPKFVQNLQLLTQPTQPDAELLSDPAMPNGTAIWIVVRRDLAMPQGKLAAQAGHAAWSAGSAAAETDEIGMAQWDAEGSPFGVLWVDGGEALLAVHKAASDDGLTSAYIVDAGRTEFSAPTPTVVGIGPCSADRLPIELRHQTEGVIQPPAAQPRS